MLKMIVHANAAAFERQVNAYVSGLDGPCHVTYAVRPWQADGVAGAEFVAFIEH